MKKIMHILFLSCLKATGLIEKKIHFKLSWRENIQLEAHKMMCNACANYEKQSLIIDKSLSKKQGNEIKQEDLNELKNKINEKLKNF